MKLSRIPLLMALVLSYGLNAAALPKTDPKVPEKEVVHFVEELKDEHPRVWFSKKELADIKAVYNGNDAVGQLYRKTLEGYLGASRPPGHTKWLKDATDGQRQGYWRLPTVVMHYAITGNKESYKKALGFMKEFLAQEHWEGTGNGKGEQDCGMSAANIMIGAGMALDVLWHDLDPEFREQYRKKCILQARRMFHYGHLRNTKATHYWQGDPANNHRWHRNAGIASCLLAAYTGAEEEQWILKKFKEEVDFVVKWLPHDGTSHESPGYMTFGISHLMTGVHAVDRCLGTKHLEHGFFKMVPKFKVQTMTNDFQNTLHYGDQGGTGVGELNYNVAIYKALSVHGLKQEQAVFNKIAMEKGAGWGWMGLLWYDPKNSDGKIGDLATSTYFEDVGVLVARDKWGDDGKSLMFKCGPFGGYTLNKYRNDNNFAYINVAHDDPDANSFIIYSEGAYLAETDRYSAKKESANHNTILINGIGQRVVGRCDKGVWWQPATGKTDMSGIAVITALKQTDDFDIVAGEAGPSYIGLNKGGTKKNGRPGLERFRRALAFAKGKYVLVLDDIRAPKAVDIDWLMQGQNLEAVNESEGRYKLISKKGPSCEFHLQTSVATTNSIVASPADKKKKPLGWKQLRARAHTAQLFTASVYDIYGKQLSVALDASNPKKVVVSVTGDGINDTWTWEPHKDAAGTYTLTAQAGKKTLVAVTEQDRPRDVMKYLNEHMN